MDSPTENSESPVRINRWIKVRGTPAPELETRLSEQVQAKVLAGEFSNKNIDYVSKLERPLFKESAALTDTRLEKLRRLCQLWDVKLQSTEIESHRKIIGPVIVAVKKMLQPVLRVLLKDFIRQQREFNAATIRLLAELSEESTTTRSEKKVA